MNPELYEAIRLLAGLGMLGLLSVVGLGALIIIGLSYDPDAWLDRHTAHWRAAREKGQ